MNITQIPTTMFEIFNKTGNKNTENSIEYEIEIHGVDIKNQGLKFETVIIMILGLTVLLLFLIYKQPRVRSFVYSIYRSMVRAFNAVIFLICLFFTPRRMELPSNEDPESPFELRSQN